MVEMMKSEAVETAPLLEICDLSVSFGALPAVKRISFVLNRGETLALVGESGSGKSVSALSILQLLPYPHARHPSGSIRLRGEELLGAAPDRLRAVRGNQIAMVFQEPMTSLNPLHSIEKQIGETLWLHKGLRGSRRRARILELLELVGLPDAAYRLNALPHELSGGQRQRIALARALAVEPKVLLLDEPFGALDAKVRKELRRWLRQLHDEIHVTSVFVTHDQEEALEVADRVVVINKGKVEQIGTPESVYDHPATPFVANFLGSVNLFHGRVEDGHLHLGEHALALGAEGGSEGSAVAFVRPHEFDLVPGWHADGGLPARILRVAAVGPSAQIEVSRVDGELIEVTIARDAFQLLGLAEGDQVSLRPRHIRVFQAEALAA